MTPVGSVGSWEAGDGGIQPETDPAAQLEAVPENTDAPAEQSQADLLMGFLADFHAAGREPPPEPEPVTAQPISSGSSYLSRFDFAPPDPLDAQSGHDLPPTAPLPVWPPVPAARPAHPAAPATGTETAVPAKRAEPAAPAGDGGAGTGRRGGNVFRRLGRR